MKIRVIKDAFYVCSDVSNIGLISKEEFEMSYVHFLVKGDVWEKVVEDDGYEYFKCIEGKWLGEVSDGNWEYETNEGYFEIIE